MAATTFGTTGLRFGLTAESGIIVISCNRTATASKKEVMDEDGDIVGVGYYGKKAEYQISATYLTSNTGVGAAAPGVALTLANQSNLNGVSGGLLVTDQVSLNRSNEDFVKIDVSATQYPDI